jgi:hypothetical protein
MKYQHERRRVNQGWIRRKWRKVNEGHHMHEMRRVIEERKISRKEEE